MLRKIIRSAPLTTLLATSLLVGTATYFKGENSALQREREAITFSLPQVRVTVETLDKKALADYGRANAEYFWKKRALEFQAELNSPDLLHEYNNIYEAMLMVKRATLNLYDELKNSSTNKTKRVNLFPKSPKTEI